MTLAPSPDRISGTAAVRRLLGASIVYQRSVKIAVTAIESLIEDGMKPEAELDFAELLLALAAVERDLDWTAEKARVLLGETA